MHYYESILGCNPFWFIQKHNHPHVLYRYGVLTFNGFYAMEAIVHFSYCAGKSVKSRSRCPEDYCGMVKSCFRSKILWHQIQSKMATDVTYFSKHASIENYWNRFFLNICLLFLLWFVLFLFSFLCFFVVCLFVCVKFLYS